MSKAPTIDSLTTVRGLAAVWVVLYHYQADIYSLFPITVTLKPFFNLGNLAVPLFFILSGFVLSYNYSNDFHTLEFRTCRKFILTRLARIYPVHFVTLLAVLLMVSAGKILGVHSDESGHSARDFVLNLFLVHTWVPNFRLNWNFPSWSISSEWFAYLWFPLVAFVINRATKRLWLILIAVGFFCLMQFQVVFGSLLIFRELQVVVGTFLTGCAIFKLVQYGCFKRRPNYYLSISASALVFIVPFLLRDAVLLATLLALFSIIIYTLAGLGDKCHRLFVAPFLVFVGEVSYSLYMTHTLVQRIAYKLVPTHTAIASNFVVRLGLLCAYAILISLATLATYYVIEKPSRKILRSLIKKEGKWAHAHDEGIRPAMEMGVPQVIEGGNV